MPMRRELPVSALRMHNLCRRSAVRAWIGAMLLDAEFLLVALFCVVGLRFTFYFMRLMPGFGEIVAALDPF